MPALPEIIISRLNAYDARIRRALLFRGLGETLLTLLTCWGLLAAIDAVVDLGPALHRHLAYSIYLIAIPVFIARAALRYLRSGDNAHIATMIERRMGWHDERLRSAVQLCANPPAGVSRWMIERTVALAALDIGKVDTALLVPTEPVRAVWFRVGSAILLLGGLGLFPLPRALLQRAMLPGLNLGRPSFVALQVHPGNARLAAGANLCIEAETSPTSRPALLEIEWPDQTRETFSMHRIDRTRFRHQLSACTENFIYAVHVGGSRSPLYSVNVTSPPRISALNLRVQPPLYAELPPTSSPGGDTEVIDGSRLTLQATLAGETPASAVVLFDDGSERPMNISDNTAVHTWRPRKNERYRIRLYRTDGLTIDTPKWWNVRVLPDLNPELSLRGKGLSRGCVGRDETLWLDADVKDDLGVQSVKLHMTSESGYRYEKSLPLPSLDHKRINIAHPFPLHLFELESGETISLRIQAVDCGGQISHSPPLELVIGMEDLTALTALTSRLQTLALRIRQCNRRFTGLLREWEQIQNGYRLDDPLSQRGEIHVARQVQNQLLEEIGAIGREFLHEGNNWKAQGDELLLCMAEHLCDWHETQGGFLLAAGERRFDVEAPDLFDSIREARDTAICTREEFERISRLSILITTRFKAELLWRSARSVDARRARTTALLYGVQAWSEAPTTPGLRALFFRGTRLANTPVHSGTSLPEIHAQPLPDGVGPENYSCLLKGEIFIPTDGVQVFSIEVDDGAGLQVAGKKVIGKEAWRVQDPTCFTNRIELNRGWHPIRIEYFQQSGGATLTLRHGLDGEPLQCIPEDRLRHPSATPGSSDLYRAMTTLPTEAMMKADERLHRDLQNILDIPPSIAAMSDATGLQPLERLVRAQQPPRQRLESMIRRVIDRGWTPDQLRLAERECPRLVTAAQKANEILDRAIAEFRSPFLHAKELAPLVEALDRIEKRVFELTRRAHDEPEAEHQRRFSRNRRALQIEGNRLARLLQDYRPLQTRRLADETNRHERLRLDEAQHVLRHDALPFISSALKHLQDCNPATATGSRASLRENLQQVRPSLHHAQHMLDKARRIRHGHMAENLLARIRHSISSVGQSLPSFNPHVNADTKELAATLHRHGEARQAAVLDRFLENPTGNKHTEDTLALLNNLSHVGKQAIKRTAPKSAKDFTRAMKHLSHDNRVGEGMALLRKSAGKLSLASDTYRNLDQFNRANAYEILCQRMNPLLARHEPPAVEELKPIVEEVAVLEGFRGKKRQENLLEAIRERGAAGITPIADELEQLARLAHSAAHDEQLRPVLRENLEAVADPDALSSQSASSSVELPDRADNAAAELLRMADEVLDATETEKSLLERFSRVEQDIAQRLSELHLQLRKEALRLPSEQLQNEFLKHAERLPVSSRLISKLANDANRAIGGEDDQKHAADLPSRKIYEMISSARNLADEAVQRARLATERLKRMDSEGQVRRIRAEIASLVNTQKEQAAKLQQSVMLLAATSESPASSESIDNALRAAEESVAAARNAEEPLDHAEMAKSLRRKADSLRHAIEHEGALDSPPQLDSAASTTSNAIRTARALQTTARGIREATQQTPRRDTFEPTENKGKTVSGSSDGRLSLAKMADRLEQLAANAQQTIRTSDHAPFVDRETAPSTERKLLYLDSKTIAEALNEACARLGIEERTARRLTRDEMKQSSRAGREAIDSARKALPHERENHAAHKTVGDMVAPNRHTALSVAQAREQDFETTRTAENAAAALLQRAQENAARARKFAEQALSSLELANRNTSDPVSSTTLKRFERQTTKRAAQKARQAVAAAEMAAIEAERGAGRINIQNTPTNHPFILARAAIENALNAQRHDDRLQRLARQAEQSAQQARIGTRQSRHRAARSYQPSPTATESMTERIPDNTHSSRHSGQKAIAARTLAEEAHARSQMALSEALDILQKDALGDGSLPFRTVDPVLQATRELQKTMSRKIDDSEHAKGSQKPSADELPSASPPSKKQSTAFAKQRLAELLQRLSRRQRPVSDRTDSTDLTELATQAQQAAKHIADDIVRPLAESFRHARESDLPPAPINGIANVGKGLAEVIADQAKTANSLRGAQRRQDTGRLRLAEQLAQAVSLNPALENAVSGTHAQAPSPSTTSSPSQEISEGLLREDVAARQADANQAFARLERPSGNSQYSGTKNIDATDKALQSAIRKQAQALDRLDQALEDAGTAASTATQLRATQIALAARQHLETAEQHAAASTQPNSPALREQVSLLARKARRIIEQATARHPKQARLMAQQLQRSSRTLRADNLLQHGAAAIPPSQTTLEATPHRKATSYLKTSLPTESLQKEAALSAAYALRHLQGHPSPQAYHEAADLLAEGGSRIRAHPSPPSESMPATTPTHPALPLEAESAGSDQADWARLKDRVRRHVRSDETVRFAEEHQAAIRAYFRRLMEIDPQ